jgi:hypothetical protein
MSIIDLQLISTGSVGNAEPLGLSAGVPDRFALLHQLGALPPPPADYISFRSSTAKKRGKE